MTRKQFKALVIRKLKAAHGDLEIKLHSSVQRNYSVWAEDITQSFYDTGVERNPATAVYEELSCA